MFLINQEQIGEAAANPPWVWYTVDEGIYKMTGTLINAKYLEALKPLPIFTFVLLWSCLKYSTPSKLQNSKNFPFFHTLIQITISPGSTLAI